MVVAVAGTDPSILLQKAAKCRRLAAGISDRQAYDALTMMAQNYQDAADRLKRQG